MITNPEYLVIPLLYFTIWTLQSYQGNKQDLKYNT